MGKPPHGSLRVILESHVEYIDLVHAMAEEWSRMSGLGRDRAFQTGLAVREALINAILHGNRSLPERKVTIDFLRGPDHVTAWIHDEGEGFDFEAERNPLDPENLYRTNGRGIFLMRSFADEVEFRRGGEGGTEVRITQRIPAGKPRRPRRKRHAGNPVVPGAAEGGEWMKASVRQVGPVTILDLAGKITIGAGDLVLREEVHALLDRGNRRILINLAKVSYMDSAGIGELVACRKRTIDLGGSVKLLNPSGKVSDLLHLTKLEEIFEIHRDEERAVASFS